MFKCLVGTAKSFIPRSILPKKNVQGQNVLITGAGSGLGRLMCLRFAELGSNIILWDVNKEGNEETATQIRKHGVNAFPYTVDLSNRNQIYEMADKVRKEIGTVDILVNNAGIVTGRKFMDSPDGLIEKTMDVNIMAHFWTVKSFLPAMLERNKGHIVNIASAAGQSGVTGLCDYCASKFAVVGFDESLRNELQSLGKDGVKTTLVCPSYINTGMFDGVKMKCDLLFPILDAEYAVNQIMQAIRTDQPILMMPRILYSVVALKHILPVSLYTYVANLVGVNDSMSQFVGRDKKD